jgi:uncharacterized protein
MQLHFEPIRLEQQAAYRKMLAQCSQIASDYSFINLWGWGPEYGLQWAWQDNLVWLRQRHPEPALWAPVGDWHAVNWPEAMAAARTAADRMVRVPEALIEILRETMGDTLNIEETPDHWDYLYRVEDLVELKGNRYHKKKNLVNQFTNTYAYRYLELDSAMIEQAMGMQEDWCTWRDCEDSDTLAAENNAIARVLNDWKSLAALDGGALIVDDLIVAYTIAERFADNTLLIHFEKACPDYKGGYQAINQQFLVHAAQEQILVNREQDLGDEGLRKAKRSYHPVDYVRKFQVTWQS